MSYIVQFFAYLMDWCHGVVPNYWADIVIFTLITKVLQYPVSLWCQANSLKMVSLMPKSLRLKIDFYGDSDTIGEKTAELYKQEHYHPLLSLVPLAIQIVILMAFVKVIYGIANADQTSLIGKVPVQDGGVAWLMPLFAGASAWLLGQCQNRINPLQREQGRAAQMATNGISIAISLFLGAFVGMGVGLYWACSNLFSILVQVCCNLNMRPERHVDYPALRKVQAELKRFEDDLKAKSTVSPEDRKREKEDYRRFFKVANKHLVFYSESSGFYRYFKGIIEWLLAHSNVIIHYVTNDPRDAIFEKAKSHPRIRAYYIGPMRIIPLFMKMDADMVVMTTPDLNTYQLKRSYVRKDVEYVYLDHAPASVQMTYRKGAFDHFDTIFANGQYQIDEHRATERVYGLKEKKMVPTGYVLLDDLFANYKDVKREDKSELLILVAPSHQPGNIFDEHLDRIVALVRGPGRKIHLRPHPQYTRRFPARMQAIDEKYRNEADVVVEMDFSKNSSIYDADILITDWSGIAYEYAFTTKRPVVFINTPMKVVNPEWEKIGITPTNITFRDMAGVSVNTGELERLPAVLDDIIANPGKFSRRIEEMLSAYFFNPGRSGEVAGRYILESLKGRKNRRQMS
ncbi:MAG: YidC/Oxa1 family membrane protein insertase [Kiritimatiellae bacterium]|nr:YidC/Oxa1 family membrane protein insertase [Kiritimatiellia bacterium]